MNGVLKRVCTSRAEWRLQPGKPAEPLSPHYRLDCDYGTGVITCWEEGGSEPIYVCESHAKQLGRPRRQQVTDIRIVTPESEPGDNAGAQVEDETPVPAQEAAATGVESTAAAVPVAQPEVVASTTHRTSDAIGVETQASAQTPQEPAASAPPPAAAAPTPKIVDTPEPARRLPDTKIARAIESTVASRSTARDFTFGNPAKAIVDEAIWNMPAGNLQAYKAAIQQGKSAGEAAEAAGGQLAMVHRKIGDYTSKLENFLAASRVKISVPDLMDKPLEQGVSEIISCTMPDSEKDAAIQQLGKLQEWVKDGVEETISPLQASRLMLAIAERVNWGRALDVPRESAAAYRTLYGNLKNAVRSAAPEVQNLHERLTNLYAAKSDLEIG